MFGKTCWTKSLETILIIFSPLLSLFQFFAPLFPRPFLIWFKFSAFSVIFSSWLCSILSFLRLCHYHLQFLHQLHLFGALHFGHNFTFRRSSTVMHFRLIIIFIFLFLFSSFYACFFRSFISSFFPFFRGPKLVPVLVPMLGYF